MDNETVSNETARYTLLLSPDEIRNGVTKILNRNGKKLEVVIPAGSAPGSLVKLSGALKTTDNREGDILITVQLKESKAGNVLEISDASFEAEVINDKLPVIVDFWAAWCGPCRMLAPVMEKLSSDYSGKVKFCKLNVDQNRAMAQKYGAMSIPLLVFFKNGAEVDRSLGAVPAQALIPKIESLLA